MAQAEASNSDSKLETILTDVLRYDAIKAERVGNSGKAIQAYMRAGIVNKKPNIRVDYTDYYLVKKPISFMGHELFMIEEEYMSKYIGCCVSEGAGITVRLNGDDNALKHFAKNNACSVESKVDMPAQLKYLGLKAKVPMGDYVTLSCRDRDVVLKSE
jgi:hypothetical protein